MKLDLIFAGGHVPQMLSPASARIFRCNLFTCAILLLFVLISNDSHGQSFRPLCLEGDNAFQANSHTGVSVAVRAAQSDGFGIHLCRAALEWDKDSLTVARSAEEIDLDLFDVDLEGLGPVAAFQIRETAVECCKAYQIYSLEKPVQPVRTLRGGTFYGADTDLDGRVEIWAEDRAAIDGFEGLNQAEIKYAPTYILRFEQGRLVDASQQFKDHFDGIIAELHKTISADDLRTFRESDGSFGNSIGNIDQWRRMRKLKIQVLEMVWAYLYSGREKEAWNTLAVMWPAADTQRVQTAIAKARSAGILRQIDGESNLPRRKKRVQVFDVSANTQQGTSYAIMEPGTGMATTTGPGYDKSEVKKAQPIQLWRPMPADLNRVFSGQEELLDLLIDSTGKVRSAKWTMTKIPPDEALLADAVTWKFIPAHRHGKSVASRMRFAVQPKR